jgi:hypothetical protein
MAERAIPQSPDIRIILFLRDIRASLPQEIKGFAEPPLVSRPLVDLGMRVYIPTVIDRRLLYIIDRDVDLAHGFHFIDGASPISRAVLDHPSSAAQII